MQEKVAPVIDIDVAINKLQEMLRASGWQDLLKAYMVSEEFSSTIVSLADMVQNDKRFTPPLKQVFGAF